MVFVIERLLQLKASDTRFFSIGESPLILVEPGEVNQAGAFFGSIVIGVFCSGERLFREHLCLCVITVGHIEP